MKNPAAFIRKNLPGPSYSLWLGSLIFIFLSLHFGLLWFREFDPDEFQHLHAAWYASKGFIPYIDFFEHHTPAMWFLFAPAARFFQPDANLINACRFIFFCRIIMWGTSGLILFLTWRLGRIWRESEIGAGAAVLLASTIMYVEKSMEFRVDMLSTLSLMTCLCLLLKTCQEDTPRKTIRFFWAGFMLGTGIMCTQKLLMVLPGMGLAWVWYVLDDRTDGGRQKRLSHAFFFWVSAMLPFLLILSYMSYHGAAHAFFYNNFILNAQWRLKFNPSVTFSRLLQQNPIHFVLASSGALISLAYFWRRESARREEFFLILPFASLLAGAYIIPVPYREYFLNFLPLGALLAAAAMNDLFDAFSDFKKITIKSIFSLSAITFCLFMFRNWFWWNDSSGINVSIFLILTALLLAALLKSTGWPKIIAFAALSFHSVRQIEKHSDWTNFLQFNNLRFVEQFTRPDESVLDGWNGTGVFRPSAWYYWFFHEEMRQMLDAPQIRVLLEGLQSGTIAPKLIFFDPYVKTLSPEINKFIRQNYHATPVGDYMGTFMVRRSLRGATKSAPPLPKRRQEIAG